MLTKEDDMETPLPTRLRNILARKPKTDADYEAYVDDLEKIIRDIETLQMSASRERLRRNYSR